MSSNIDQNEVNKFSNIAEKWWDPKGEFKPLHVINPLRAKYVASKINLDGKLVLDVGCGGGLPRPKRLLSRRTKGGSSVKYRPRGGAMFSECLRILMFS